MARIKVYTLRHETQNSAEIELKFRVSKQKFLNIKRHVKQIARFDGKFIHKDEYYKAGYAWLSLRERSKNYLSYKRTIKTADGNAYQIAISAEVKDIPAMRAILTRLGFKKSVTVRKRRELYITKKGFEIAFDKVLGLGYFIEVEAIKKFRTVQDTIRVLAGYAETLGLDPMKAIPEGYPTLKKLT